MQPSNKSSWLIYLTLITSPLILIHFLILSDRLLVSHHIITFKKQSNLPLRFNSDGTFKILQVADMHYGTGLTRCRDVLSSEFKYCSDLNTTLFLKRMIHAEKPDFIAFTGDIINRKDVEKAFCGGIDCVFHLASFGMSGKEMLQYARVDDVNINGTCHVLEACHQNGVNRLVYVSTSNVVFAGNEILNGNENLPYIPLENHVDPYSRSKSIAEQLVLKTNARLSKNKNGECFYTCAIRPAAIYGPGEERHLPRIINLAKLGLLPFKIGEPSVKSDWVYIDNLILALILASMALLDDIPGRIPIAAGQPYFISDGNSSFTAYYCCLYFHQRV